MIPRIFIKCRYIILVTFILACCFAFSFIVGVNGPVPEQSGHRYGNEHGKYEQSRDSNGPQARPHLNNPGKMVTRQELSGLVFLDSSQTVRFSKPIVTSVVHSFSVEVLKAVRKMFRDGARDNMYYATLPALIRRNGTIILVQRIWLGQYEFADRNKVNLHWTNYWQENYLYTQTFDEDYRPLTKGELLGIPTTTNIMFQYRSDGPMDPRLITIGDKLYLLFHTWASFEKGDPYKTRGRVHLWDFQEREKIFLQVSELPLMNTEINWCPVVKNDMLYLLYSLDPLRVLKCDHRSGKCKLVYSAVGADRYPFKYQQDHLRGGTPFVEYSYPYYVSFSHSVLVTSNDWAVYSMHLLMISVEPQFRIVYVSDPINVSRELLYSVPVVRNFTIMAPFVYPVGILQWSDDVFDIGVHLNDYDSHVIRVSGMRELVGKAIKTDRAVGSTHGASVRRVQTVVGQSVFKYTGSKLNLQNVVPASNTGPGFA